MTDYVSVCILSFNRPQFVEESLRSLDHAGYPLEIVVGDDGSEPEVQRKLLALLHEGRISRLVMNPVGQNEGVGAMVNRLFSVATGDILAKADQDLLYEPGAIAEIVRVLRANETSRHEPLIGTLGGFRYWTDPVDHNKMVVEEYDDWTWVEDYVSSFLAVRRKVWETFGQWEEHSDAFAEDIDYKKRLREMSLVHGLTKRDVIVNRGFGVGPSTVVVRGDEEHGHIVQSIHHEPRILNVA